MGKKKQQSIDTHLKFAGGGGTGANHDVIELSGAEDDTAMDVSNMSTGKGLTPAKPPTTRRAVARKAWTEETEDERYRREDADLQKALEESCREKEREDRRNRQRQKEDMEVEVEDQGNGSREELISLVTSPGKVPISSPQVSVGTPPRKGLLDTPSCKVQPPRPPLLSHPVVQLEKIAVQHHRSPHKPHPPPTTPNRPHPPPTTPNRPHPPPTSLHRPHPPPTAPGPMLACDGEVTKETFTVHNKTQSESVAQRQENMATGDQGRQENMATGDQGRQENMATGDQGRQENMATGDQGRQENMATRDQRRQGNMATGDQGRQGNMATGDQGRQGNMATGEQGSDPKKDSRQRTLTLKRLEKKKEAVCAVVMESVKGGAVEGVKGGAVEGASGSAVEGVKGVEDVKGGAGVVEGVKGGTGVTEGAKSGAVESANSRAGAKNGHSCPVKDTVCVEGTMEALGSDNGNKMKQSKPHPRPSVSGSAALSGEAQQRRFIAYSAEVNARSPPLLYAPEGTPPSQYTSVILRVFDDYIRQLEAAQSRQLVRVPWGPPVTTKATVSRNVPASIADTMEVWTLPFRKELDTDNRSDDDMESDPFAQSPKKPTSPSGPSKSPVLGPTPPVHTPKPHALPSQPSKSTVRRAINHVTLKNDVSTTRFCDSSDEDWEVPSSSRSHQKPTYTITTITPTKASTVSNVMGSSSLEMCSPVDKDLTPPLSGGRGPFECKRDSEPTVLNVSPPALSKDVATHPSSSSTWLSKRGGTTPGNRDGPSLSTPVSRNQKISLARKRKLAKTPGPSSFDELVNDVAKRHKETPQPSGNPVAVQLHRGDPCKVREEEEEEVENDLSEETPPTRKGVIDLTEDSQATVKPGKTISVCPLCQKQFSQSEIEDHASTCQGEVEGPPPVETQKVRSTAAQLPSNKINRRVVSESSEDSSRECEVLSGSPNEGEEEDDVAPPYNNTPSSPRVYPSTEGGFIVDMDTVSNSPIKSFVKIGEQASSSVYYRPFASSGERQPIRHAGGQRSHKTRWKGRGGGRKGAKRTRGKVNKFILT